MENVFRNTTVLNIDDIKRLFVDTSHSGDSRRLHVDHSSHMPSLSMEQVENGASKSLGLLYGIRALRADLNALRELGLKWEDTLDLNPLIDQIPDGINVKGYRFISTHHKLLYDMLMRFVVDEQHENCYKTLENAGCYVFLHEDRYCFKDSETGFFAPLQLFPAIEHVTSH